MDEDTVAFPVCEWDDFPFVVNRDTEPDLGFDPAVGPVYESFLRRFLRQI